MPVLPLSGFGRPFHMLQKDRFLSCAFYIIAPQCRSFALDPSRRKLPVLKTILQHVRRAMACRETCIDKKHAPFEPCQCHISFHPCLWKTCAQETEGCFFFLLDSIDYRSRWCALDSSQHKLPLWKPVVQKVHWDMGESSHGLTRSMNRSSLVSVSLRKTFAQSTEESFRFFVPSVT